MKQKISLHFIARASSAAVLAILLLLECFLGPAPRPVSLCVCVWWAAVMLLLYPASHGSVRFSLPFIGGAALLSPTLFLLNVPAGVQVAVGGSLFLGYAVCKGRTKFLDVELLFHVAGVWNWVEDYTWYLHACAVLWSGAVAVALPQAGPVGWIWLAAMSGLYYVEYRRVYTRSTMFLTRDKENIIRKVQRGSAFKPPVQFVDSASRSAVLFNEVVSIMENRKPWLQDDFGIDDLARMTSTNRMYLSKAINFHSGRNFNQLVNYYRVRYARDLMNKDSHLKMNELSKMCGFHTVVSFNMAFKLNERMTPTQYAQSLKTVNPQ